ncbi:hypothetical protein ADK60_19020 [Streptomyces sp. XY431]|uniref:hypothetical protein n=1 Tax=Streptomyces sp. XY431 TaxID=1415562 RepID=UPI0006AFE74C|nr:hypothetical protein [Streptomyces sp. XY431]KOV28011.1 hypothetical protein ADK60_19020 [Streptomyces sp. XY431]
MTLRVPGPVVPARAGVSRRGRHRVLAVGLALAAWALLGCAVPGVAVGAGSLLTVIDNSGADSIVEIDRTADLLVGHGSAGSDHDGSTSVLPGLLDLTGSTAAPPAAEEDEGDEE